MGTDHLHPYVFVTNPPLVFDPNVLIDASYCVCEGGWGIYYNLLLSLGLGLSYVIFVLGFFSLEFSLWTRTWKCLTKIFGRQGLKSPRLPFQVGNDYFNYFICLFQPIDVFCDVFDVIPLGFQGKLPIISVLFCELFDLSICLLVQGNRLIFPLNLNVFHYFNPVFLPGCR